MQYPIAIYAPDRFNQLTINTTLCEPCAVAAGCWPIHKISSCLGGTCERCGAIAQCSQCDCAAYHVVGEQLLCPAHWGILQDAPTPTTEITTSAPEESRITYNPATRDYDAELHGEYLGSAPSYVDAERLIEQARYGRMSIPTTPQMELSRLALEYGKARAEGRMLDAARLKLQGMRVQAEINGIQFEVFEAEYAAYLAERRRAA